MTQRNYYFVSLTKVEQSIKQDVCLQKSSSFTRVLRTLKRWFLSDESLFWVEFLQVDSE